MRWGRNDHILGAHIVGAHGGELLAELALAIKHKLGLGTIFRTSHVSTTYTTGLSQAVFEALVHCHNRASTRGVASRNAVAARLGRAR